MTDLPAPPYPSDTRAKGWRFELDLERVMQSDTWALAAPEIRPWLLMLWTVAWQQVPCGSMPSEEALIAARLGMKEAAFKKAKTVLLRGWKLANDGRLYHETITERVIDMLGRKEGERKRKAEYRARMEAERKLPEAVSVPQMSRGTDMGQTRDSGGSDATGTGTGTGTGLGSSSSTVCNEARDSENPIRAGQLTGAMREFGIQANPADPRIIALAEQSVLPETVRAACEEAKRSKPNGRIAAGYIVSIIERWANEASTLKAGAAKVPARATPQKFDPVAYVNKDRVTSHECPDDYIDV
ncbi:hypothetical protein BLA6863_00186 [Burkholderia lata]|uniref:DUF1376 domain-containing protein n=1 Tax=Burkholderia lata (strain ATCC 17760 / DSM 23089 / LMG 22485 / NCIMB 9086 / R18194 / 383) TaxID=482957 RepID=A0A6P2GTI8_BURL3|nr:hypothetical protein BLA6863_00186 [Burkholderia lata]